MVTDSQSYKYYQKKALLLRWKVLSYTEKNTFKTNIKILSLSLRIHTEIILLDLYQKNIWFLDEIQYINIR